jgi:hypothetical protein
MNWNQPLCDPCWNTENPDRVATRLAPHGREIETCCMCGKDTLSGIYVRRDPKTVYFPAS